MTAKRNALEAAALNFSPATHRLLLSLAPAAADTQREQIMELQASLEEARRVFLAALTATFTASRQVMREPITGWVTGMLDTALAPVVKNKFLRRQIVRRSDLMRKLSTAFAGVEGFSLMPMDRLHREANAVLALSGGLLAGRPIVLDTINRTFSVA